MLQNKNCFYPFAIGIRFRLPQAPYALIPGHDNHSLEDHMTFIGSCQANTFVNSAPPFPDFGLEPNAVTVTHSSTAKEMTWPTPCSQSARLEVCLMKSMHISYMSTLIWEKIKRGGGRSGRMLGKLKVNDRGINYKRSFHDKKGLR